MQQPLNGSVAFVTGGAQGLGEAICRSLGEAGARIVVADLQAERAEAMAEKLRHEGVEAVAVAVDVTDAGQADAALRRAAERFGRVDILVNNAAVDRTVPIEELTPEQWNRIIATNLTGPFVLSRLALPAMKQRRSGHIVNIVSTASKRAWANASAYHASKWGLLGFSHALHVEARPFGVKVLAVVSGGMRTPFLLDRFPDLDPGLLQDPRNVADTIRCLLQLPAETVVPEVMVIPMRETSWP
ncbi:SDR family oxidoreductase [Nitrospira moscoviensis]|uniref:Short-chain dehydrogenase/reductase n=1 Tax=Nitrospira moscoviensis TaxID=42253 RepID=A0A0K2GDS1_NITMO|nr:SDR family oxidoreductase [Nitrospira moscoviensis]ALA58757.1 Short-chain dehydrogenase/reductase [Nitrospira moscoviensis]